MNGITQDELKRLSKPFSGVDSSEDLAVVFDRLWSQGVITGPGLQRLANLGEDESIMVVAHPMDIFVPEHTHAYIEVAYVLGGRIVNVIGGKERYMFPGSVCIMPPGSKHALKPADSRAAVVNLCLAPRMFSEGIFRDYLADDNFVSSFLRGEASKSFLMLEPSMGVSYEGLVQSIVKEYVAADGHQTFRLVGYVLALLGAFTEAEAHGYHGADEKTLAMLDYIRGHLAGVSVASLAHEFGYNRSYLSQHLMRRCGKGPSRIIQEARLREARNLLAQTDLSVAEIARKVGYASPSRLHQLFRDAFGETPGEYRARQR